MEAVVICVNSNISGANALMKQSFYCMYHVLYVNSKLLDLLNCLLLTSNTSIWYVEVHGALGVGEAWVGQIAEGASAGWAAASRSGEMQAAGGEQQAGLLRNEICRTCKLSMTSLYQAHHSSTYATLCAPHAPHALALCIVKPNDMYPAPHCST
jgi:hypothetical protein